MNLRNFDIYAYRILDAFRATVNPNQMSFVQQTRLERIGADERKLDQLRLELNRRCKCAMPESVLSEWVNIQDVCDSLAAYNAEGDPPDLTA